MSRQERTGWRDQRISERHRSWGLSLPAQDLDFVLIEYDKFIPKALIEYKHEDATPQSIDSPQCKVLQNLGNLAGLPSYGVRYTDDFSSFAVVPLNDIAKSIQPRCIMNEQEYIAFLHKLRGHK